MTTILSLFDVSGVWSGAYRETYPDYEVHQFDIQRSADEDVRLIDWSGYSDVQGVIMQPPCTHFASSGARWWAPKGDTALREGLELVWECARAVAETSPAWWVVENPVGRLRHHIGAPRMTFQPCDFAGHADDPGSEAYTKRTCLWGNFNAPATAPRLPVLGSKMHRLSSTAKAARSLTPQGFARAFALANP